MASGAADQMPTRSKGPCNMAGDMGPAGVPTRQLLGARGRVFPENDSASAFVRGDGLLHRNWQSRWCLVP
jgi:hypothetical protein